MIDILGPTCAQGGTHIKHNKPQYLKELFEDPDGKGRSI